MYTRLTRDPHLMCARFYSGYGVIQFRLTAILISSINGPSSSGDMTMRCAHELHRSRIERQQIISAMVFMFPASIRDATGVRDMRDDFTRVNGPVEKG